MKKKLLSLMICCIMLTGCGAAPTQGVSERDIKSKEDTLKDSQAHIDVEETFITKFDGTNAIALDDEGFYDFQGKALKYVERKNDELDNFLGYDCFYDTPGCDDIMKELPEGYSIWVLFDSEDSFNKGMTDIDNYLSSISYESLELSNYNDSFSKSYICKDKKDNDYVVLPIKRDCGEMYEGMYDDKDFCKDCIKILVLTKDYYENEILVNLGINEINVEIKE